MRHNRLSREDLESFETTYNAACLNIAKGELKQGEVLLNRAKSNDPRTPPNNKLELTNYIDICGTSEELSAEDKAAELVPITVQQLYVLIRLGKLEEAEKLLEDISVDE